jgi:hypothetical protein
MKYDDTRSRNFGSTLPFQLRPLGPVSNYFLHPDSMCARVRLTMQLKVFMVPVKHVTAAERRAKSRSFSISRDRPKTA